MERPKNFFKTVLVLCVACLSCCGNFLKADDAINDKMIVTIDGGSATKKSPISQAIAEKFNFVYVETGALYRTVVEALMRENITSDLENKKRIKNFLRQAKFEMHLEGRTVKFSINGICLTPRELRSETINSKVAEYSSRFKSISDFCTKNLRSVLDLEEIREFNGVIAEGRTCGTYIFPEADLKFWFYATDDAKVDFRLNVEKESDNPLQRDSLDFSRKFYPMSKPDDAIVVWTSSRSIKNNTKLVWAFVEQKSDLKKHSK